MIPLLSPPLPACLQRFLTLRNLMALIVCYPLANNEVLFGEGKSQDQDCDGDDGNGNFDVERHSMVKDCVCEEEKCDVGCNDPLLWIL
jgi:hypothetical protein